MEAVLTKEKLSEYLTKITDSIGFGLPEKIYQNALDYELRNNLFEVQQEYNIDVVYGLIHLGQIRADLIVNSNIIIELKAVDKIKPKHQSQLKRYLRITKIKKGFLINISYDSFVIEELDFYA